MFRSSQPRSEMTCDIIVNNNKDEGAAMIVKYQRHLLDFHRNGECSFLY